MGVLDRLRSLVGVREDAGPVPRGPLGLHLGDEVSYYKETWRVFGMRHHRAADGATWQYILRAQKGAVVVLVAEDSPGGALWIERAAPQGLAWDKDLLAGAGDEPLKLAATGRVAVEHFGDTPQPRARHVEVRRYRDAGGDRTAVHENWYGRSEGRIGDTVYEAELTIVRGTADASPHDGVAVAEPPSDEVHKRGSPLAAARALATSPEMPAGPVPVHEGAADPHDSANFDDEEWNDTTGEAGVAAARSAVAIAAPGAESEEREWRAAARYLREHGVPAEKGR